MQPMTPRRILGVCAILASALFVAMVVSLRLGAYPMSVTSVVTTLYHGVQRARWIRFRPIFGW